MGETGRVVGIEHIPELVEKSVANIRRDPKLAALLTGSIRRPSASSAAAESAAAPRARISSEVGAECARVRLVCGDGRSGVPDEAPYDAIHVGAAAPSILEEVLLPAAVRRAYMLIFEFDSFDQRSITRLSLQHFSVFVETCAQLIRQLRPGGLLVCPVGAAGTTQHMYVIEREPGGSGSTPHYTKRSALAVSYVPLTDANKQTSW